MHGYATLCEAEEDLQRSWKLDSEFAMKHGSSMLTKDEARETHFFLHT